MKNIGKGIHMLSTDIGVDLGTASILVYIKGKGVVLKEPSVVAFDRDTNKIKAIGEEARLMLGRTPCNIVAVRPLRQGVISDYRVTEKMLKYFIQKAIGKRMLKKPRISVCVPSGVTEVEKKAVEDAKKNLIHVPRVGTTIPHEVNGHFGAGKILIMPAKQGTGVIAGGPARAVLELAGLTDVRAKSLGSNNPRNMVNATIEGLNSLKTVEEIAKLRGKKVEELLG